MENIGHHAPQKSYNQCELLKLIHNNCLQHSISNMSLYVLAKFSACLVVTEINLSVMYNI